MRKNNPAVYECPIGKNKLHTWRRNADGSAQCVHCKTILNKTDADDVWRDR